MLNVAAVQAELEYRAQQLVAEAEEHRRAGRAGVVPERSAWARGLRRRLHGLVARHDGGARESSVRAA
jgi:hypothetical protein